MSEKYFAKIVAVPADYPYSSARAHFGIEKSDIRCDDLFQEA